MEDTAVETTESYKQLDENHPNSILTETLRPAQRINKKSILTIEDNLKDNYHFSGYKEPVFLFDR